MKKYRHSIAFKGLLLLALAGTFEGCAPTPGTALPSRKKMPAFDNSLSLEGGMPFEGPQGETNPARGTTPGAFAFATSNVDLMMNGSMQGFVSVALPDPAMDSLALSLVSSFKPFALPLLSTWAQQQKRGVLIDLSRHSGAAVQRTDYLLEEPENFSIPVVVMWDRESASRVATLEAMASELPSVKFSKLSH